MALVQDYIKLCKKTGFSLTKYLDSTEASELHTLRDPTLNVFYNGGYADAERIRAIIIQKGEPEPSIEEFEIGVVKVVLKSEIKEITHRHVLGTLMSFGIKREVVGDILINDDSIYIFTTTDMQEFIKDNLYKINGIGVDSQIVEISEVIKHDTSVEKLINTPSLRLDAVIAKTLNKARGDAVELIEKGLVQINHVETSNNSYFLKPNDLISIRHFGRIEFIEVVNTTKKDRLVIKVKINH